MRIIQLNNYITLNGGSESVMSNLSELLTENGHVVTNIGYTSISESREMPNAFSLGREKYSLPTFFTVNRTVDFLIRKINDNQTDLIICHNVYHKYPMADLLQAIKAKTQAKLILIFHDYKAVCPRCNLYNGKRICTDCTGGKFYQAARHRCRNNSFPESAVLAADSYYNNSYRHAYNYPDLFISPSHFMARQLNKMGFGREINVIHNPINLHLITRSKPSGPLQKTVLYAGRFSKDKGIELFLQAAAELPDTRFLIAGTGDLLREVEDADQRLDNLNYLGVLNREQLFDAFDRSDFLVLPSIWYENNPMIVIEAMTYGLPVIGSDLGGIPELLESGRGFLFNPAKPGALAEKIRSLESAGASGLAEVTGKAREFAQTLSSKQYYIELCRLLPELAN